MNEEDSRCFIALVKNYYTKYVGQYDQN